MQQITLFQPGAGNGRRMVSHATSTPPAATKGSAPSGPDKWAILRALTTARRHFGVTDRDLGVLTALLSCHAGTQIDAAANTIVFASNQTLSSRAHGMPESTLRRHLAALVASGLIERRDSANGKRYARKGRAGVVERAFGFDLLPLARRYNEIIEAAETERAEAAELLARRETLVLRLRNAAASLTEAELAPLRRLLRRVPTAALLDQIESALSGLRDKAVETTEMSGADGQNERHYDNQSRISNRSGEVETGTTESNEALELTMVADHCPGLLDFGPKIQSWEDLLRIGQQLTPYLGIPERVWAQTCALLGRFGAAALVAVIAERSGELRNPAAYLLTLRDRLMSGGLSWAGLFRTRIPAS